VLVHTAGDAVFLAGADLDTLADRASELMRIGLFDLFEEMEALPVPVVTAVQGLALGGGFEFALCSDLVVAAEQAVFGLPETSLGLAPGIGMLRLGREIGTHLAKELAFTGRRISAQQALDLHLVNRVVPRSRLLLETRQLAREIADRAPIGVRITKEALNRPRTADDWTYLRSSMRQVFDSDDLQEGLTAFRQRRPAHFTGQ
jgi:enoyl-CoA hydratase/carnithine racemase